MKTALPWILAVIFLAVAGYLFSVVRDKDAELVKLRQDAQELVRLRAENEEFRKKPDQTAELARLRKDNEEVLRLRSEARQFQKQIQKLTTEVQQAQALSKTAREAQEALAKLTAENKTLATQAQIQQSAPAAIIQANTCIDFLRHIDSAKQQWALEHKKTAADVPTPAELTPYLANPTSIVCPAGGTYSINAVGVAPTCSMPGHAIPGR